MADPTVNYNLAQTEDGAVDWGQDIRDNNTKIDNALGDHDTVLTNHSTRIGAAETSITDHESRLDAAETSITDHETRIDTLEASAGAAGDADSIHGRDIAEPAAADDGRVLAYDSGTDSYIWVAAPTATEGTTGGTGGTGGTVTIDPALMHYEAPAPVGATIAANTHFYTDFQRVTFSKETLAEIKYSAYLTIGTNSNIFMEFSKDNGATWTRMDPYGTLPAGFVARKGRSQSSTSYHNQEISVIGTFSAGEYLFRMLAPDGSTTLGTAGHMFSVYDYSPKTVTTTGGTDADYIQGVPVSDLAPAAADDGKVLTYDAATNSFVLKPKPVGEGGSDVKISSVPTGMIAGPLPGASITKSAIAVPTA